MLLHLGLDQPSRLATIETFGTVLRDALESTREVDLLQHVAQGIGLAAALRELRDRGFVAALFHEGQHAAQRAREPVADHEPVSGQIDRGLDEPSPG